MFAGSQVEVLGAEVDFGLSVGAPPSHEAVFVVSCRWYIPNHLGLPRLGVNIDQ